MLYVRGTAALGLPRREQKWIVCMMWNVCQNAFKISIYNHLFWYNLKSIMFFPLKHSS